VIGGVGTGNNASLSDIFGNSGGGGGSTTPQASSIGTLQKDGQGQAERRAGLAAARRPYASATRPSDEATAWQHYVALKPSSLDGLQRLALAQAQVATNYGNQAQTYQQAASPRRQVTTARSRAARSARSRRTR